jgi:hypothetical protein
MASLALSAAAACLAVSLQGCGSGGDGSTTSTSTSSKTTTTTTTSTVPQIPALSGAEAAAYLNEQYMGLSESDPDSPIGTVIHMGPYEFYCARILNTSCYMGKSDCMCSTSVYNHKMILSDTNSFAAGLDRKTGMVFNTSLVHSKLAKCAYQFDGASDIRYNHGCGSLPAGNHMNCDDKLAPFYNLDPDTMEEVTDKSELVTAKYCPNHKVNPTLPTDDQCYWMGAGFYPGNDHPDELRKMIDQRLTNQKGKASLVQTWNEIVLDVELIHQELLQQPALVIPAMLWVQKENDEQWNEIAQQEAQAMAIKFKEDYHMPEPVPVIAVQSWLDVTVKNFKGPFASSEVVASSEAVVV